MPDWVNSLEHNFIIASGSGSTIDIAKEDALSKIKESIIKSIADNIKSESTFSKSEMNSDKIFESFISTISSISGKIDFISGISLINADDFYWEKIKDKKNKTYHFNYHVKYPFSSSEMDLLIDEYKFKDNQLTEELNRYVDALETVSTIEEIKGNIEALKLLKNSFIDKREDICEVTIQKYINLIKKADVVDIVNETGLFKFAILINNKRIRSAINPKVSSNCANITSNTKDMDVWTIKYDVKDCFEDETNFITITFDFPYARLKRKVFFNASESKLNIKVNESIGFVKSVDGEYKAVIKIESDYPTNFVVESIVLEFMGMNPINIADINMAFGKNKVYKLVVPIGFTDTQLSTIKESDTLNGYITYKSKFTGEGKTYRIYKKSFYIE